jgi:hypothetical protein
MSSLEMKDFAIAVVLALPYLLGFAFAVWVAVTLIRIRRQQTAILARLASLEGSLSR